MFEVYLTDHKRKSVEGQEIIIRKATLQDILSLAQIIHRRTGGDVQDYMHRFGKELSGDFVGKELLLLVAEKGDKVVGYARAKYFHHPENPTQNIAPEGWYLMGVTVLQEYRGMGIGQGLTKCRLDWIFRRAETAYYFANAQNLVSIELHKKFGFVELTREFHVPNLTFTGGQGILFRLTADFYRLNKNCSCHHD